MKYTNNRESNMKFNKTQSISAAVFLVILFILLFGGFTVVQPGEVGIKIVLGQVSKEPLQTGIHFYPPLVTHVGKMSTRLVSQPDTFAVLTVDSQAVKLTGTAQYVLRASSAPSTYSTVGTSIEEVAQKTIQPTMLQVVKDVTSKYTMKDLIEQQIPIAQQISSQIEQRLKDRTEVDFYELKITGTILDPEVQQSVERKQIALQELERKDTELETALKEAQRLKTLDAALSPQLILQQAVDKWDGHGVPPTLGQSNLLLEVPQK